MLFDMQLSLAYAFVLFEKLLQRTPVEIVLNVVNETFTEL